MEKDLFRQNQLEGIPQIIGFMKERGLLGGDLPSDSCGAILSALLSENGLDPKSKEGFLEIFPDLDIAWDRLPPYRVMDHLPHLKMEKAFVDHMRGFDKAKKICVCADYDADGIMANTIFLTVLRTLGYDVHFSIPNRLYDHYGMKMTDIEKEIKKGTSLFITVDNGISEGKACEYIRDHGADIIITDHHIPAEDIPSGDILIIDPKYNDDDFQDICGAAVALKLAYALMIDQRKALSRDDEYLMNVLVPLAGIATITDCMPMVRENRILVKALLSRISFEKSQYQLKLAHILKALGGSRMFAERSNMAPTEDYISFYVGPCINAVSRVNGDVSDLANDLADYILGKIQIMPSYSAFNRQRQSITKDLLYDYSDYEEANNDKDIGKASITFVYDPGEYPFNPKGIYGLIANRLLSESCDAALIGGRCENGMIEFSGRSTARYDLHDGFERIKAEHPELRLSGGGHAHAMGIRLEGDSKDLWNFKRIFDEDVASHSSDAERSIYEYDDDHSHEIYAIMKAMGPYGVGFRPLEFHLRGEMDDATRMTIIIGGHEMRYFGDDEIDLSRRFDAYFHMSFDTNDGICMKADKVKGVK